MSYLEDLKKLIADSFEAKEVKSKDDIDKYANMTKYLDSAIDEHSKLVEANNELSKHYTELALHTTIGSKPNEKDVVDNHKGAPQLEDFLNQFVSKN